MENNCFVFLPFILKVLQPNKGQIISYSLYHYNAIFFQYFCKIIICSGSNISKVVVWSLRKKNSQHFINVWNWIQFSLCKSVWFLDFIFFGFNKICVYVTDLWIILVFFRKTPYSIMMVWMTLWCSYENCMLKCCLKAN